MGQDRTTLDIELGFSPRSVAIEDPDHPGLMRAGPRASAPYGDANVERHICRAVDGTRGTELQPSLHEVGFDVADLSGIDSLQEACERVCAAGEISDNDAATIRAALNNAELSLAGGSTVSVAHVSDEGFIMRSSGPNGLAIVGELSQGMNGHGVARSVHVDQDVFGTPLLQLMEGRAPEMFRYESPDGSNSHASLMLVNLWIPLQQIVQPLALADGRTIDRRSHQLRYGLHTGSFLDRKDEMEINDIWAFLHDDAQRWYVRTEMDHRNAYVFDTLSTPHGSCTLPGEDVAEQLYRALEAAEAATKATDVANLVEATSTEPQARSSQTPPPLKAALDNMQAVLDEAGADPEATCENAVDWLPRARAARRSVERMSLELRMVVSLNRK